MVAQRGTANERQSWDVNLNLLSMAHCPQSQVSDCFFHGVILGNKDLVLYFP